MIAGAWLSLVLTASLPSGQAARPTAAAEGTTAALRARAFDAAYNLDYPQAVTLLEQAIAKDPNDPANHRARAIATWLHIVFMRGSVTVDQYMGAMTRNDVELGKPPASDAATFQDHASKALQLSEQRLAAGPHDVQALYDTGASLGILASYSATVEGRVAAGFRQARRAYDLHEEVLKRDPRRKDACLVVGTYRYIVSTLPLYMRWMAYLAGFGGDRSLGVRMVEEAARYPSESQTDARIALLLLYNREGRFVDALNIARNLVQQYPRNRVMCLELGATAIRAGQAREADRVLSDCMTRFASDPRPRAFGEEALFAYKRGVARVMLRDLPGATADLQRALTLQSREWVKGRINLERGKIADLQSRRDAAKEAYQIAARIAGSSNDPSTKVEAERLLSTPYR